MTFIVNPEPVATVPVPPLVYAVKPVPSTVFLNNESL